MVRRRGNERRTTVAAPEIQVVILRYDSMFSLAELITRGSSRAERHARGIPRGGADGRPCRAIKFASQVAKD